MHDETTRWDAYTLKFALEGSTVVNLEKLIANPGKKYRREFADEYVQDALRYVTLYDALPEEIRMLLLSILELHEKASDPDQGMNLPEVEEQQP
jgi:hypothetical protein